MKRSGSNGSDGSGRLVIDERHQQCHRAGQRCRLVRVLRKFRTRRRLLEAARSLREHGVAPPGVDDPSVYAIRTGRVELPRDANWVSATAELRKAYIIHPDLDRSPMGDRII